MVDEEVEDEDEDEVEDEVEDEDGDGETNGAEATVTNGYPVVPIVRETFHAACNRKHPSAGHEAMRTATSQGWHPEPI